MEITGNLGTTFHFSGFGAPLELGRAGFVGYPIPNFPQSFWQEPAPPMNHAPRPTDFNFSPEAARGCTQPAPSPIFDEAAPRLERASF